MIEMGDAIVIFGILGTISTAIIKLMPRRSSNSVTNISIPDKCPAHSGLVAKINNLGEGIGRLETGQHEMHNDIKELMKKK